MGGVGGQFRLNQHGQQDVPNKQKATGGYKHKPFTSISYSIAIMVCADTPKTDLTGHTGDSKNREVAAFPPPLPKAHFSRGLFPHPPRWPETKRKTVTSRPGRPRLSPCNLLTEPPTPAPSSLNFPRASPRCPQSVAPRSRFPTGPAPTDRRAAAASGAGAPGRHGGAGRPEPSSRGSERSA